MSQIDIARMALVVTLTEEYGFGPNLAAKATLAAHPLDDNPVPSRAFEKHVRKVNRRYGKALRNLRGKPQEAEVLTLKTLQSYKDLAIQHGESRYINRYDRALDNEPPTVPPPESGYSQHRRGLHEAAERSRQEPWEPAHISRDQTMSRILELAVRAGYEDPDVSTPIADSYSSEFRLLLDEVMREFRLFKPGEIFNVQKSAPFRLSETEIEQISVIGDLVDPLGKYIRKAHEAHINQAQAHAEELERLKQLADTFEADGIRVIRDSEGYPDAIIHPDSTGDSIYKLDLLDMYAWTVEEFEAFVRKWVSESQAGEAGLEIQDDTEV